MSKFVILADITCDISQEIRDYFGVEDYIRGHIHFSDGRDFITTLDWSNIERGEFYKALSNKKMKINTAPASPEEYYEIFKKYAKDGYDILSMSICGKVSSTYGVTCVAAKRIQEEYPERKICCVDSHRMSGGFGLLVAYAHKLKNQGKSMDEIIEWIDVNKHRVHQMGPIDDLMFVARRGSISTGKAIMGNFAGVKPMGDCNNEGQVAVLGKVKGIKKALETTVRYIKESAVDIENQYIIISHSDREMYAKDLAKMIEAELKPKKLFVSDVFVGGGTNIGPGMICAYYFGNPVSEDGRVEKEMMNKAMGAE